MMLFATVESNPLEVNGIIASPPVPVVVKPVAARA
jgi:hypothetical protein